MSIAPSAPTVTRAAAPATLADGQRLRAVVFGATGYAGGELVRLLSGHPGIEIVGLVGRGRSGEALGKSQPHLARLEHVVDEAIPDSDLAFVALPHGAAATIVPELAASGRTVFDLGADFRLKDPSDYPTWYGWEHPADALLKTSVYGLPELHRAELAELGQRPGGIVGVPGCYPTATILAVAPLARAGLVADVVVDAKSGVSGAGREPKSDLTFAEVNESVKAYGIAGHRHTAEMLQELGVLVPVGADSSGLLGLEFIPHLIPMTRGILATCYVRPSRSISADELADLYEGAYAGEPFVRVVADPPATKHVLGSNEARVFVRLQPRTGRIVAMAAIDNLIKGAAGQAIQALNIVAGIHERTGLDALPVNP